jgi:hypothetical protein
MEELISINKSLLILTENSSFNSMQIFYDMHKYKMFAIDQNGNILSKQSEIANSYNYFAVGPLNPLYQKI